MIVPRGRLPLADSESMQIRHEISLIVVCRMAELGNRPFCGSDRDRPKTATRPRSESIRRRLENEERKREEVAAAVIASRDSSFRLVIYVREL